MLKGMLDALANFNRSGDTKNAEKLYKQLEQLGMDRMTANAILKGMYQVQLGNTDHVFNCTAPTASEALSMAIDEVQSSLELSEMIELISIKDGLGKDYCDGIEVI